METVAAFANTRGGTVLIGVHDDGTVRGITLGKESLREWANHIAQATHLHPQIGVLSYEDKTIVVRSPAGSHHQRRLPQGLFRDPAYPGALV